MFRLKDAVVLGLLPVLVACVNTGKVPRLERGSLPLSNKTSLPPVKIKLEAAEWELSKISGMIRSANNETQEVFRNQDQQRKIMFNSLSKPLIAIKLPIADEGTESGSYSAIVNREEVKDLFFGIVAVKQQSRGRPTFTVVYKVEDEMKSGAYLNDGTLPETVLQDDLGKKVSRADIAKAILDGRTRLPEGDLMIGELEGSYRFQQGRDGKRGNRDSYVGVVFDGNNRAKVIRLVKYDNPKVRGYPRQHTTIWDSEEKHRLPEERVVAPKDEEVSRSKNPKESCEIPKTGYIVEFKSDTPEKSIKNHFAWIKSQYEGELEELHIGQFRGYVGNFNSSLVAKIKNEKVILDVSRDEVLYIKD
ncbi:hypothetical protein CP532_0352 [Ophiocordyceps camponoti-leonardi (nom. inval.)]|nr:hypothetical protein CP532_0352 [Ophiocordyceps camponoti-leonardi (nom. inval.)]